MLRISRVHEDPNSLGLKLEGRIIGEWVVLLGAELEQQRAVGGELYLDLSEVQFASRAGVALLRNAQAGGVKLRACSALLRSLIGNPAT